MNRITIALIISTIALLLAMTGCTPPPAPDEFARYSGGAITRQDIEEYDAVWLNHFSPVFTLGELLHQAQEQELVPQDIAVYLYSHYPRLFSFPEKTSYESEEADHITDEQIARRLALEAICLERIRREPEWLADRAVSDLARPIRLFFQALEAGLHQYANLEIPQEAIHAYYQEHQSDYLLPEYTDLRHLFVNAEMYHDRPARTLEEAGKLAEDLYQLLLQGESFAYLISRHSDSDTRERGGWLLGLEPGILRAEVEEVLQQMEPGEIAPPITTPIGIHLIQLIDRRTTETIPLEQVRDEIQMIVASQAKEERYRALAAEAARQTPYQVFPNALESQLPGAVILSIGDNRYSLEEIEQDLLALEPAFHRLPLEARIQSIHRLAEVLLYLQWVHNLPLELHEPLEARFKTQILVDEFLYILAEQHLEEMLNNRAILRDYYIKHSDRYYSPWMVRLSLADIPLPEVIPEDPVGNYRRRQERFEEVRHLIELLQSGESIADSTGIRIQAWRTQRNLRPLDQLPDNLQDAVRYYAARNPGRFRLPVVLNRVVEDEERILIVRILELIPSRRLSFEESLPQLRKDFIEENRNELIQEIQDDILKKAGYKLLHSPQGG